MMDLKYLIMADLKRALKYTTVLNQREMNTCDVDYLEKHISCT